VSQHRLEEHKAGQLQKVALFFLVKRMWTKVL